MINWGRGHKAIGVEVDASRSLLEREIETDVSRYPEARFRPPLVAVGRSQAAPRAPLVEGNVLNGRAPHCEMAVFRCGKCVAQSFAALEGASRCNHPTIPAGLRAGFVGVQRPERSSRSTFA